MISKHTPRPIFYFIYFDARLYHGRLVWLGFRVNNLIGIMVLKWKRIDIGSCFVEIGARWCEGLWG